MSAQRSPRGSVGASAPQTHHFSDIRVVDVYANGNVRPISRRDLERIFGDPINLYDSFAEALQAEPEPRHLSRFDWSCIAVALISLAYFVVRVVV